MNVLFVAAEATPLVKTGGLADVAGALPPALRDLGHDVRVVMPRYRRIRESGIAMEGPIAASFLQIGDRQEELRVWLTISNGVPTYLLDVPSAFERDAIYGEWDDSRRFILFTRGVLALMQHLREVDNYQTEILHANDWHAGLLANYIRTNYSYTFGHIASVYTIHNLAYQGWFGEDALQLAGLANGENYINFMARGIIFSDIVSTVSPTYAEEIVTPEYGERLDSVLRARQTDLVGILNGIDWDEQNPATDKHIAANYSVDAMAGKALCKQALQQEFNFAVDPARPLIGLVTRLTEQKGLDLLDAAMPWLIGQTDAQIVILGAPHPHWGWVFGNHARAFPERVALWMSYNMALAQRIYAGADMFLMPSRFEPGGLGQLMAMRYGTVPVVRATGGLNDTVIEGFAGNGFRFHPYETSHLCDAIKRAIDAFKDEPSWAILRERGMREDHSWAQSAQEYVALYARALAHRA